MIKKIINKTKNYIQQNRENKLLERLNPDEKNLITDIKSKNLTYLTNSKLGSIVFTINNIENQNLAGLFVEAGCALGGSSILISKLKSKSRLFNVYDVFEMIPPPSDEDTSDVHERYQEIKDGKSEGIGGELYYGYEKDLFNKVISNLRDFQIQPEHENVHLIKGLVQDTMNITEPVAFGHIDVDWYDPVKTCLEQLCPNLIVGGSIILDDYYDWGGCKKATDEYFKNNQNKFVLVPEFGSLKVTRIK